MDGHADNAAASTVGGLVAAARIKNAIRAIRLPLDVSLVFVVIVPDVALSTTRARQLLPPEVSRESAAFNLSRLALLLAGLADSRLLEPEATEDRLHQDYRSPLFPAAPRLLATMAASGALAVCWSGQARPCSGSAGGPRPTRCGPRRPPAWRRAMSPVTCSCSIRISTAWWWTERARGVHSTCGPGAEPVGSVPPCSRGGCRVPRWVHLRCEG